MFLLLLLGKALLFFLYVLFIQRCSSAYVACNELLLPSYQLGYFHFFRNFSMNHTDGRVGKFRHVVYITTCLNAPICCHAIGRLGIYINVQVCLIRYHTVSVVWPVVSFSFQTHSPRANPESWAWPWFPATTWCPSRWRQTAWTTHRDSELTTDGAPSVWTAFMWLSPAEPDSRPWSIPGERTTAVSQTLWTQTFCVDVVDSVSPSATDERVRLRQLLHNAASAEMVWACMRCE